MRIRTAVATAVLLLATLTACGSSDQNDKPAAKTSPSPSPTAKKYTFDDCKDLLEYDYQQGEPQDASKDPECSHLSSDEYTRAVTEVLTGHKDEILQQSAREVMWDEAWDEQSPADQKAICAQIEQDGVDSVGEYLKSAGAQPAGHETEMAQYYLDSKC